MERQEKNNDYKVGPGKPPIDKQWKPGQSGNPKGRPPSIKYISDVLRELLEQDAGDGKTNAEKIAEVLIELAKDKDKRGYVPALRELLDRAEGKVPTPVSVGGLEGKAVVLRVVYDNEPIKEGAE